MFLNSMYIDYLDENMLCILFTNIPIPVGKRFHDCSKELVYQNPYFKIKRKIADECSTCNEGISKSTGLPTSLLGGSGFDV